MGNGLAKSVGMQEASISVGESVKGVLAQVCASAATIPSWIESDSLVLLG
jgi:hypothetical protein